MTKQPTVIFGLALLGLVALVALAGPALVSDPTAFVSAPHEPPSAAHWLGTNGRGQDVLAQTVAGARVTLAVGFAVGLAVTLIGSLVGTSASFFGGWIDQGLSVLINVFLLIPALPLAIVLAAYLPPTAWSIFLVLTLTGWAWNARLVRAEALSLRQRDFVQAALVGGDSSLRIITVEMLPNLVPLLLSCFINATVYAIGASVGLEFLGLGDLGAVTWGTNLYWASNDAALLTGSWWMFVPTGLGIALVGLALVMVSFGLEGRR
jgi:ABC-type dipeptide/oligopeptide/nickel transport system permease subunit